MLYGTRTNAGEWFDLTEAEIAISSSPPAEMPDASHGNSPSSDGCLTQSENQFTA